MSAERLLEVARGELGVREATGRNDGEPAFRYNHGDRVPWCASFVLYCLERAGYPVPLRLTDRLPLRNVNALERWCEEQGWWFHPSEFHPEPGDLVFFSWRVDSDAGLKSGRHVGIVERVTETHLQTIEGNTRDRVAKRVRPRRWEQKGGITGYARPAL